MKSNTESAFGTSSESMTVMKLASYVLVPLLLLSVCVPTDAVDIQISPDVVYGHKFGLATTFDVFTPGEYANGAAVLFMVSGWLVFALGSTRAVSGVYGTSD